MLFSKDEKMEKMEKRLNRLEKIVDRKFSNVEDSFKMFRDIVIKLQNEKANLQKENTLLTEKYKEMLRKLPLEKEDIYIHQRIFEPVRNEIKENTELIRKIAKEGIVK